MFRGSGSPGVPETPAFQMKIICFLPSRGSGRRRRGGKSPTAWLIFRRCAGRFSTVPGRISTALVGFRRLPPRISTVPPEFRRTPPRISTEFSTARCGFDGAAAGHQGFWTLFRQIFRGFRQLLPGLRQLLLRGFWPQVREIAWTHARVGSLLTNFGHA